MAEGLEMAEKNRERACGITDVSSVVVYGAHPDDAVRACCGIMLRSVKVGARLSIIGVTNGDAYQSSYGEGLSMAERRKKEQFNALSILNMQGSNVSLMGLPDQGLEKIKNDYWKSGENSYFSPWICSDHVIDKDSSCRGMPFSGELVLKAIKKNLKKLQPTHIFTHHSKDEHSDHRAVTYFVKKAVSDLIMGNYLKCKPAVYGYLTYYPRIKWPPDGETFLCRETEEMPFSGKIVEFHLTQGEQNKKFKAFKSFEPTLGCLLGGNFINMWTKKDEVFWEI